MSRKSETIQQAAPLAIAARPFPEPSYNILDADALSREHSAIEQDIRTVIRIAATALPLPHHIPDYSVLGQFILDMQDALDRARAHTITCFALIQKSDGCA